MDIQFVMHAYAIFMLMGLTYAARLIERQQKLVIQVNVHIPAGTEHRFNVVTAST